MMTDETDLPPLDVYGSTAAENLRKCALAHDAWEPRFTRDAHAVGLIASLHVKAASGAFEEAARHGVRLPIDATDLRRQLRCHLRNWCWIESVQPMPPLRSDGVDPDVARLCGLPEDRRRFH